MTTTSLTRLSVFPLAGAILFPRLHLPLHIFEPRYRAMVSDAMARDQMIAMVQPNLAGQKHEGDRPALFRIGCVGKIAQVEALDDGRYNLVLEGQSRFRIVRELEVTTPFRQVEAELIDDGDQNLSMAGRAALENESRSFAEAQGYAVDWDSVTRLDDEALVNGIAQIAPFDAAAKQALLEVDKIGDRAELIIQLLHFFGRHDGDNRVTLQ
jgi:uncharacterized protein